MNASMKEPAAIEREVRLDRLRDFVIAFGQLLNGVPEESELCPHRIAIASTYCMQTARNDSPL
jgi:hypothetical protein